jgi:cullin 4
LVVPFNQECGAGFTNKLEGMFKDMELSKEIVASFRESKVAQPVEFELNIFVLTFGYWPTFPATEMILPQEFLQCQANFSEFYLAKHSGRRLTWQNSLGHCIVNAVFPKVL